jgi:excisionase family DNA binding protein
MRIESDTCQRLLTAEEAARWLNISPRTLWGLTASGELPHLRIGRLVRYDVADLKAWIQARKGDAR